MICFARCVAEVSSSFFFHAVEYRLTVDTGEAEGKDTGGGGVNQNSHGSRCVSCGANRDLGESGGLFSELRVVAVSDNTTLACT